MDEKTGGWYKNAKDITTIGRRPYVKEGVSKEYVDNLFSRMQTLINEEE